MIDGQIFSTNLITDKIQWNSTTLSSQSKENIKYKITTRKQSQVKKEF